LMLFILMLRYPAAVYFHSCCTARRRPLCCNVVHAASWGRGVGHEFQHAPSTMMRYPTTVEPMLKCISAVSYFCLEFSLVFFAECRGARVLPLLVGCAICLRASGVEVAGWLRSALPRLCVSSVIDGTLQ
jgi:hypothetical protein